MRTVAVSLTRATSNRGRTQGPQSAGSASNQRQRDRQQPPRQVPAAAGSLQFIGGNDECQESPQSLEASKGSRDTNASSELKSVPSGSRNRRSRSTVSAGCRSLSAPGSGEEGDNEDTDTSGSRTSCIDLVEYYNDVIERLEQEKWKEDSIMGCIGSILATVASMNDSISGHVQSMFGVQRLTADRPRKFPSYRKKGVRSTVQEEAAPGPNSDFERRLQAIRAYVDDGSDESEAIAGDAEVEASTAPIPEEGACISTPPDAKRATASSPSGAVAGCSGEITPTVVTHALRQESYEECVRRRQAARKSWYDKIAVVMSDVLEQRILKGKHTCRAMLRCMKSVADVVSLALESYRAAELAMQKARASADDTLHAITTAAAETSVWMWRALKQAETAVAIHEAIVGATKRAEQSLIVLTSENPDVEDVMREIKSTVAHLRLLVPRFAVFDANAQQSREQESGPSGEGSRVSTTTEEATGFQSMPVEVLHNLLSATTSSLQAVGETNKALELIPTSVSCSGKKSRKGRGSQENSQK